MAAEVRFNQGDIKDLLGKVYDENKRYTGFIKVFDEDDHMQNPSPSFYGKSADYAIEPGHITVTSTVEADFDDFAGDETDSPLWREIHHWPLEKIKALDIYDTLVKDYGFDDDKYLEGDHEAFDNYIADNNNGARQMYQTYVSEYDIEEEDLERLERLGEMQLYPHSTKVLKVEPKLIPPIFEKLNLKQQYMKHQEEQAELGLQLTIEGDGIELAGFNACLIEVEE